MGCIARSSLACVLAIGWMAMGARGRVPKLEQHDHNTTQNVTHTHGSGRYQTYQKEHIYILNSDPPAPKKAIDFRWCKIQTYMSEGWDHHSISRIWLVSPFNGWLPQKVLTPPFYSAGGFCRKFVALTGMFLR